MGVRVINRIPQAVARVRVRQQAAAELAARMVERQAKANVPVDTGKLRDSITVERHGDGFRVGPSEFYAHLVEFGSTNNAPHPYLIPAAEQARALYLAEMRKLA